MLSTMIIARVLKKNKKGMKQMYTVQITVASVYPRILSVTEQGTYILMHEVYYCKSVFSILKEIGELYFYFRG